VVTRSLRAGYRCLERREALFGPIDEFASPRSSKRQTAQRDEKGRQVQKLTPCLWFDTEGEEAATFYTSVFPNSKILEITHYGSAGPRTEGTVMTVSFELDGQKFLALNGGPDFKFNEAISFEVSCDGQEEVDSFWSKLSEGGEEGPCGWLKDRFGVSWQIVPTVLVELLADPDQEKAQRVMAAMLKMRKIDVDELERAAEAA
jgi:predicted 3-demethylubiquinone-9 3-methyltransferase (glyoxalase superfamily)